MCHHLLQTELYTARHGKAHGHANKIGHITEVQQQSIQDRTREADFLAHNESHTTESVTYLGTAPTATTELAFK